MFYSRNPLYKNPVGAVPAGENVHFRICLSRDLRCSAAQILIEDDTLGTKEKGNLFWCGMNGETQEWWECDWTPPVPGLYFYHFRIDSWRGTMDLFRGTDGEGVLTKSGERWQLTSYDPLFQTPDWLAGGIMYQVFPDRFCNSGTKKAGIPKDRKLHELWGGQPDWQPDAKGEITNSDYFGGDLKGIEQKLPYLKSLGVTCLYLNPIFEAHSNHRYNTASYEAIDPILGSEEDFKSLCAHAKELGIRVLLDGVFSHTGSDSIYFNRENRYQGQGAYNSAQSPYSPWYSFRKWPDDYDCWWGFITLPNVNELNPEYDQYINGANGIVQKWLRAGASGWRLDVADELPDDFLDNLRSAAKSEKPDALVLGEVWEDASNKSAYGKRRKYLLGEELDSVMNYPFRDAVLGFLTGGNAGDSMEIVQRVLENYPPQVVRVLMNHIGTHDTERALTILAGEPLRGHGRHWQSETHLTPLARSEGLQKLRLAAALQFTLPGVPCVYYGDEAGLEGYRDPFNRGCYPWGEEEAELLAWYRTLGEMRSACACLKEGDFLPLMADGDILMYERSGGGDRLLCAVNRGNAARAVNVYPHWQDARVYAGTLPNENNSLLLPPKSCALLWLAEHIPETPKQETPDLEEATVLSCKTNAYN